ncbi:hypothetical protein RISK_006551 [Rhodopirellula islandica]|uniref:Uncharacterized protein n=1 Tax=Rhodopirellula islandica TaxID=595434 RepID=A0A0J1B3J0_RHOIS|nr:hypothetical protein [Rhodopirellula islandica]KLU01395.1 hypothetical protein RISK_006551 [Rhodopirellula islandica]
MSVTISIAPTSEDTWIIRNAVYRWLVARVADLHADQPDVVEQLTISGYCGGISLDRHLQESPELARRIADALRATIDHIRTHAGPLTDDSDAPWPELQPQVCTALDDLQLLLDRFAVVADP